MVTLFVLLLPLLFIGLLVAIAMRWANATKDTEPITWPRFGGWSILLGVLGYNIFAHDAGFGIGWGLFFCSVIAALLLSFDPAKRTPIVWLLGATGMLAGLFFGWRANEFVQQINVAVALLTTGSLLVLRTIDHPLWSGVWLVREGCVSAYRHLIHVPAFLRGMTRKGDKASHGFGVIIRTMLITLVCVLFFAKLLTSADPVFGRFVDQIWDQMFARAVLSAILAAVAGLTLTLRSAKRDHAVPSLGFVGFYETFIPALALALLFGSFLAVQATYLFGSHDAVQAFDLTYSDYVRKGFTELLVVTFFGTLVCYALIVKGREFSKREHALPVSGITALLIVELGLVLASALKRDWLYMDTYGLTRVRLIGEAFLVWLGGALVLLLLLALWRRMREPAFLTGLFALSAGVFLFWNVTNMDAMIANAVPPRGQDKDIVYIALLSADASHAWPDLLETLVQTQHESLGWETPLSAERIRLLADTKLAAALLARRMGKPLDTTDHESWQEYNWSKYASITRHAPAMAQCVVEEITDLQFEKSIDLSKSMNTRYWDFEYPFVMKPELDYELFYNSDDLQNPYASSLTPFGNKVSTSCARAPTT